MDENLFGNTTSVFRGATAGVSGVGSEIAIGVETAFALLEMRGVTITASGGLSEVTVGVSRIALCRDDD